MGAGAHSGMRKSQKAKSPAGIESGRLSGYWESLI
jgi:hypothetical protein